MCVPIVLVLFFRIFSAKEKWVKHSFWGMLIAVLMAITVFSISPTEIPFFPMWTGMGQSALLMLLWIVYGQICANLGRLGGLHPKVEPFVYGALCGIWASVQTYRESPKRLGMAFSGACLGRIGLPSMIFCANPEMLFPLAFILAIFLYFFLPNTEESESVDLRLWGLAGCTWCLTWVDPFIGLSLGCAVGVFMLRRLDGWMNCLSFWLFATLSSSLLAGIGFLELCARYMEGGVIGEQVGLSYDILAFGLALSIFCDPMVTALSVSGLWERALDVQHLSMSNGLFVSSALGQLLFVFYAAGCVRKGKWVWSSLFILATGYVCLWEVMQ